MTALSIWEEKLKSTFSYLTFFPGNLTSPPKPTSFCTAKTPHLSDCRIVLGNNQVSESSDRSSLPRRLPSSVGKSINLDSSKIMGAIELETTGTCGQNPRSYLSCVEYMNISAQFCDGWFIHGGGCVMRVFMLRIFVSNMSVIHIQHQQMLFYIAHLSSSTWAQGSDLLRKTKTKLVTWFQKIR